MRKTEETDKFEKKEDRRKSPVMKPRTFDGSTPVASFLQQFRACDHYYKLTEEESGVQLKCTLSKDTATLVWLQTNLEQITVEQLQDCCARETVRLSRKRNSKLNDVHVGGRQMKSCQL